MVYGWLILIILIVGFVIWQSGIFDNPTEPTCTNKITGALMTLKEATSIAEKYCEDGLIHDVDPYCNNDTGTWWFQSNKSKDKSKGSGLFVSFKSLSPDPFDFLLCIAPSWEQ